MRDEHPPTTGPTIQQAVDELRQLIQARYPGTTVEVGPGGDDPAGTYIIATVDLDDPDEVLDLVIERVLALQVEEGMPIHVVPIRTPERVARLRQQRASRQQPVAPLSPLAP